MATASKHGQSIYAGFLNGYIAGNLSANSQELHFHLDKIQYFLRDLRQEVFKWDLSVDERKKIEELFAPFATISTVLQSIDNYLAAGVAIYELLSYVCEIKRDLPSAASFIFKKIIYHYLNIAKTSKNAGITKVARRIAEKFDSSDD